MCDLPVMLITGSSRGIGRHIANYYSNKNYITIGISRNHAFHEYSQHYSVDVCDVGQIREVLELIKKDYGRVDVLINNAGVASMNHSLLMPKSQVLSIFNTNVMGTFFVSCEVAKLMMKNNYGRIVNFSSVASPMSLAGEAIYASSKTAIVKLTQIMAKEFAGFGITVNCIGPNPVKTDLIKNVPEDALNKIISQQAIKRYGKYEDIINVIDFYISDRSNFITAQNIYLGGVS
jgi:3-oxoacyl-[acyl-carrier protein] reductase